MAEKTKQATKQAIVSTGEESLLLKAVKALHAMLYDFALRDDF
jgi:hypothetical protein